MLLLLNVVLFCSVLQQLNVFCCYWANSMLKMCLLVTQRAAEIEFALIWIFNQPQLKYTGSWCRFLCLQFAILLSTSWWHWITKYNQISCPENASSTIHRLINAAFKAYIVLLKWSDVYRIAYIDCSSVVPNIHCSWILRIIARYKCANFEGKKQRGEKHARQTFSFCGQWASTVWSFV